MDLLIIASIGIYEREKGEFFLQIITADQYNFYHVKISKEEAKAMADVEDIEISEDCDHAQGSIELAQSLQ